jgi:twitching motility protein PilT
MRSIHELLEHAIQHRASDLLLKVGTSPTHRVDGRIAATTLEPLSHDEMEDLALSIIYSASRDSLLRIRGALDDQPDTMASAEERLRELQEKEDLDLVFTIPNLVRVRCNLFLQRNSIAAALRIIPLKPYSIEELGLPAVLKDMVNQPQGLIIVTGPTGSGKSTTLASMLDHVNEARATNIVTVEDPIEYVFEDKKSVVHQREVGLDTQSFSAALRSVLRQSPDVIMIGEMRDPETMSVALTAAEMGHLVLSTLHTTATYTTIDRLISGFPPYQKDQICSQLATSLIGIVSQRLLHRLNQPGRVPAVEVMTNAPTIRKLLEEGNTADMYPAIREGQHFGMNTMNQALERLYHSRVIGYDVAILAAGNVAELRQMLRRS